MPPSTTWRRRPTVETSFRGVSPPRISVDEIERITPERDLSTQHVVAAAAHHNNNYSIGRHARSSNVSHGLGIFTESIESLPSSLYLDQNGSAYIGAKQQRPLPQQQQDRKKPVRRPQSSQAPRSTSNTWQNSRQQRGHTRSGSNLDDLASYAVALSPQLSTDYTLHGYDDSNTYERPSKRIRSERLYQAEWSPRDERPRTSYIPYTSVSEEHAYLLLSLAQERRVPRSEPASSVKPEEPSTASVQQALPFDAVTTAPEVIPTIAAEPSSTTVSSESTHEQPIQDQNPSGLLHHQSVTMNDGIKVEAQDGSEEGTVLETVREPKTSPPEQEQKDLNLDSSTIADESNPPSILPTTNGTAKQHDRDALPSEPQKKRDRIQPETVPCPVCHSVELARSRGNATQWIGCEMCKRWSHQSCAGFSTQQEAKSVDKYICKDCQPLHGETTYLRKSSRPKRPLDYAAWNEGVIKSSAETTMHHYVPRFKDGSLSFKPDDFARIRPELLTEEFWENMNEKRPFVIPACWNPRFGKPQQDLAVEVPAADSETAPQIGDNDDTRETGFNNIETVIDVDQDYLDMVMPRGLTVQKVAEMYGPHFKIPVIDVKSQDQDNNFTIQEWADYYDMPGEKPIRNVISLEVSHSKLGRLIRRPKVVRDIDLEQQVWDPEIKRTTEITPVAYYCLMSVKDSYTDFHIDFGGSSVYYHILKGVKTFFFIPPEDRYLKKYEEWHSSKQNETWLPDLCNGNVTRVDLHEGDTAFIPAGWIHAVWTPEDSLVIGGNFLTRYDLDTQIKVAQIETATHTPTSQRYPFFTKVMWYTLAKYLEDDPVPEHLMQEFLVDPEYRYLRANPIWFPQDVCQPSDEADDAEYNARSYSKNELRGVSALRDFLYRTARIYTDLPVENNPDKKSATRVKASIPKNIGDPLQNIHEFAIWCAWKIGNVTVPEWVHKDQTVEDDGKSKKSDAFRIKGERASERNKTPAISAASKTPEIENRLAMPRVACKACRRLKLCRHREPITTPLDETAAQTLEKERCYSNVTVDVAKLAKASPVVTSIEINATPTVTQPPLRPDSATLPQSMPTLPILPTLRAHDSTPEYSAPDYAQAALAEIGTAQSQSATEMNGIIPRPSAQPIVNGIDTPGSATKKGRSKACEECRKSKRRCVHDEYGRVDPAKAAEPSKPRGSSSAKRPLRLSDDHIPKRVKQEYSGGDDEYALYSSTSGGIDAMIDPALLAPAESDSTFQPLMPITDVNAISMPPQTMSQQQQQEYDMPMTNGVSDLEHAIDPSLQQSEQPMLPRLQTLVNGTPEHDTSFSPLTVEELSTTTTTIPVEQSIANTHHSRPTPLEDRRRHSSLTTATSPKAEAITSRSVSRRSSSDTSGTTHHIGALVSEDGKPGIEYPIISTKSDRTASLVMDHDDHKSIPVLSSPSTTFGISIQKQESTLEKEHQHRSDTVMSNNSDVDEDEKMARELQAQEHGLRNRRRGSLRAS